MVLDPPAETPDMRQLCQQVYERLRMEIVTGQLSQGKRLAARELAKRFGVSSTPVRDALNWLAKDGLVLINPRSGARVARFSVQDLNELYQLRLMIEPFVVEQTAQNVSRAWIEKGREILDRFEDIDLEQVHEEYELFQQYRNLDTEFHLHIVSELKNERLLRFYRDLNAHWRAAQTLYGNKFHSGALREHRAILAAYERHSAADAALAMADHLTATIDRHMRLFHESIKRLSHGSLSESGEDGRRRLYDRSLADRLRNFREEKGWSQARVARELGVSQGYLSQLERGNVHPSAEFVHRLERWLEK